MTTYQRPRMLKRAVKSVLKQTFKDWELIIIDDFSQDETPKICQRFVNKDSRIRYIRNKSNSGTHAFGKNQGIKEAQADLIAYLDDDNEYRKDHLQVLYKYITDKDIVYGDRWLKDRTGKGNDGLGIAKEFNAQMLQQMNYIDTSDVLIRKKCLEKIGGWDEALLKFADWNLWVRCAKAGFKFMRIPMIITDYYVHEGCNQFKHASGINPLTGQLMPTFDPAGCKIWPDKTSIGKRASLRVAIFTLTMDRLEYTKRMYSSMREKAGYVFDWYVVDNGSKDGTVEWLKKSNPISTESIEGQDREMTFDPFYLKNYKLNKKNQGISKASNQALDMISEGYDIIIKVDNDCEFMTDNWLKDIVDLYERQRQIVVSPRVEGLRDNPGGVPRTNYFYIGKHFLGNAPHLGGLCIAALAELYKNFRWEDDDFLHGDQDYIFSQFAVSSRCILSYLENIIVEHMDTTSGQEEKFPEYLKKRKELKTIRYEPEHK